MKNKLLFVADLGCLKIYRVEYDEMSSNPRMELIESFETIEAHGRRSDFVTDESGRKGEGGLLAKQIGSYGEKHNAMTEVERRSIKHLAKSINEVVRAEKDIEECYFAASKEIHKQILAELQPSVRAKIVKKVPDDLIHVDKMDLLKHFAEPVA